MKRIHSRFLGAIILIISLLPLASIYAEGSKNLYPSGIKGRRAYLTSYYSAYAGSLPFQSYGTHYVYAKKNETIALASSAWTGNATIKLYNVSGVAQTLSTANSAGRIASRAQELAGPKLTSSDGTSNRYLPIYYTVPEDGIYKVEFYSKSTNEMTSANGLVNTKADATWNSWNNTSDANSTHIGAWDISVINTSKNAFISGRVYANMLNMRIEGSYDAADGFYGKMYVLTKDGYTYLVDNNGDNGILFSFFVNNNGFVKGRQSDGLIDYTPIYKSLSSVNTAVDNKQIWDPTGVDDEHNITHKMFYSLPNEDLPKDVLVRGAVPGGTTWLKNKVIIPTVENPEIRGIDGTVGQVSNKGGYIQFETGAQGAYTIEIKSVQNPVFPTRYLYGTAVAGSNKIYWDGKDGVGNLLPAGLSPAEITVELQGAEVHFPYFDMENNLNGIKLMLLNHEKLPNQIEEVVSDVVYWNDADLTKTNTGDPSIPLNNSHLPTALGGVGSTGIRSDGASANGHKWGGEATTGTFGDLRSMDTWTFIKGEKKKVSTDVILKVADLKVTSITTDKEDINIDDVITYTVRVKNGESTDGNSDVTGAPFSFILPPGFEPEGTTPVFSGNSCGTQSVALDYDSATRTYSSSLDLPNGCEITYTFKVKVTETSTPDDTEAVATILRPNDVTDPNATNSSDPGKPLVPDPANPYLYKNNITTYYFPPTNPFFECEYSSSSNPCNNIERKVLNLVRKSDLKIEKSVNKSLPGVGSEVIFTLKITNLGPHDAANVVVADIVPSGYTINTINNGGQNNGGTITWNIASLANGNNTTVSFAATVLESGEYLNEATVTGDGQDPDLTNNRDTETVTPCREVNIFKEDFGESSFPSSLNDYGRKTSQYMPSGSFTFGIPYSRTNNYDEYEIDNNHYAVVAPGYIKAGTNTSSYYFWTPAYNEANTVTDRSGTESGAVMVVNAGNTLNAIYERRELLEAGVAYKASFWLYLVKGPSQLAIDIKHPQSGQVLATLTTEMMWGSSTYESKWTQFEIFFVTPAGDCAINNVILSFRNHYATNYGNDYYIDDIRLDKTCTIPSNVPIIDCPDPVANNFWHGTIDNDWAKTGNWTAEFVPASGEDVEFATTDNNGASGNGNGKGAAVNDLFLDTDRIIGSLINNSDVDLVVTTDNKLTINGTVQDSNPNDGTIVVKASPTEPSGTLLFANPANNQNVGATVEFYNKAYDCVTCGFYTRSWQYFGIPVQNSGFPYLSPQVETINQWSEPTNGNKWITPASPLKAFKGYEITNSSKTEPTHIYSFDGELNVGNAAVPVTNTAGVNYRGMNLIANSYTAAIPISSAAIQFSNWGTNANMVYLFNTGTRDQWRKTNGSTVPGTASGQYTSVPFATAGSGGLPSVIPSMQTFMIDVASSSNVTLAYNQLTKNELISSGVSTRSASVENESVELPHIVLDVIGTNSADRVWLFENAVTTRGYDNGWDGRKIVENNIVQAYVSEEDEKYQVATVPDLNGTKIGLMPDNDNDYELSLSVSPEVEMRNLYLYDRATGSSYVIRNNAEYMISGAKGVLNERFVVTSDPNSSELDPLSDVDIMVVNNAVRVKNQTSEDCVAMVYDLTGRLLIQKAIGRLATEYIAPSGSLQSGVYIVKVYGKTVNTSKRVVVR